jgi:hypothetical protein
MAKKFPNVRAKYSGPVRLLEKELEVDYGRNRTIFIEHMNDLFAEDVPPPYIFNIIEHCRKYPSNTYVFQTKNPGRIPRNGGSLPVKKIIGTTIETNRDYPKIRCAAPTPQDRASAMVRIRQDRPSTETFVTIEPILDFDVDEFLELLVEIRPAFVNIGADSKGIGLPEPSGEKVLGLIRYLGKFNLQVRKKLNLGRLIDKK